MEMVDSVFEFTSSRSITGKNVPNFELHYARIVSSLNEIIQNSYLKKEVSLEKKKAQKEDGRLHDLRLLSSDWRSGHSTRFF